MRKRMLLTNVVFVVMTVISGIYSKGNASVCTYRDGGSPLDHLITKKNRDERPPIPVFDAVSVDSGRLRFSWHLPEGFSTQDVDGYRIRTENSSGSFYPIGSDILDPNATSFLIPEEELSACGSAGSAQGMRFVVVSFKGEIANESANENPKFTQSLAQINAIKWDSCSKNNKITITPYHVSAVFDQEIIKQEIFRVDPEMPAPLCLGEIPLSLTEFVDNNNILPSTAYSYFLKTTLKNRETQEIASFSCPYEITTGKADETEYYTLKNVTVTSNGVELTIRPKKGPYHRDLYIYRSKKPLVGYELIKILQNEPEDGADIVFIDEKASPEESVYFYKVSYKNECDDNISIEDKDFMQTIFLKLEADQSRFRLDWNSIRFDQLEKFHLYRKGDVSSEWELRKEVSNSEIEIENEYSEIPAELLMEGQWKYVVKAFFKTTDIDSVSFSNIVSSHQKTRISMPNAFRPKSTYEENKKFKPKMAYVEPGSYSFRIYNRWGELIFETQDVTQGWDGRYKGGFSPSGGYVYFIEYIDSENQKQVSRGSFILVE